MILLRTTEMNVFCFSGFANFLTKYPIGNGRVHADMDSRGFPLRLSDFFNVLDSEDCAAQFDESFRNTMIRPFMSRMTDACCEEYRANFQISGEEPVVLISGISLYSEQWLYGAGANGNPNYFLHSDLWESYGAHEGFEPLAFELGSSYLRSALKLQPGEMSLG